MYIFAVFSEENDYISMGLTGFDSGLKWYVSMRSDDGVLHNKVCYKFYLAKIITLSLPNRR